MTVTRDDLRDIEKKMETTIEAFTGSINRLAVQLQEQTSQMAILCNNLAHGEEKYNRIEQNQIAQGRHLAAMTSDIVELKTKLSGHSTTIERIIYPIIVAALIAFFTLGKS